MTMINDKMLQNDVLDALNGEPLTATSEINVMVSHGIVTLTGKVDHFSKKFQAENAVRNVIGVKEVIDTIDVSINSWEQKNDIEITAELLSVFRWNWNTLNNTIKVNVINSWVTLSGELEWNYQREAAKTVASNLIGVKGVTNLITIKPNEGIELNKRALEHALKSHVALDVSDIIVAVSDCDVMLKGSVDTWYQKELAGRIAWKAPGVVTVTNELVIEEEQSDF